MRSARISGSCPRTRPVEIGNADGAEEWDAARPDDDAGYGLIVLINKVPRRIAAVVEGDTATPIFARQTVIEITRDQLDIPAGRRGTPLQDDRFVALRPSSTAPCWLSICATEKSLTLMWSEIVASDAATRRWVSIRSASMAFPSSLMPKHWTSLSRVFKILARSCTFSVLVQTAPLGTC